MLVPNWISFLFMGIWLFCFPLFSHYVSLINYDDAVVFGETIHFIKCLKITWSCYWCQLCFHTDIHRYWHCVKISVYKDCGFERVLEQTIQNCAFVIKLISFSISVLDLSLKNHVIAIIDITIFEFGWSKKSWPMTSHSNMVLNS